MNVILTRDSDLPETFKLPLGGTAQWESGASFVLTIDGVCLTVQVDGTDLRASLQSVKQRWERPAEEPPGEPIMDLVETLKRALAASISSDEIPNRPRLSLLRGGRTSQVSIDQSTRGVQAR